MPAPPTWLFVCASNKEWTWRSAKGCSKAFSALVSAITDAEAHGFSPSTEYWAATENGRTTHYRPGRMPLILRSGQNPGP